MVKRGITNHPAQKITPEVLRGNPLLRRLIRLRAAQVRENEAAKADQPDQGALL